MLTAWRILAQVRYAAIDTVMLILWQAELWTKGICDRARVSLPLEGGTPSASCTYNCFSLTKSKGEFQETIKIMEVGCLSQDQQEAQHHPLEAIAFLEKLRTMKPWSTWKEYHSDLLTWHYKIQSANAFHKLSLKQSALISWKVSCSPYRLQEYNSSSLALEMPNGTLSAAVGSCPFEED